MMTTSMKEGEDTLLSDKDILWLLLGDCLEKPNPIHWQYYRFYINDRTDKEFATLFRFKRSDIPDLMHALHLRNEYTGGNGTK